MVWREMQDAYLEEEHEVVEYRYEGLLMPSFSHLYLICSVFD